MELLIPIALGSSQCVSPWTVPSKHEEKLGHMGTTDILHAWRPGCVQPAPVTSDLCGVLETVGPQKTHPSAEPREEGSFTALWPGTEHLWRSTAQQTCADTDRA